MSGRTIPTRFELIPNENVGSKTVITYNSVEFNVSIADDFFSEQNMQRLK
jgi:outer membrane lipoprotein-sorting protein